MTVIAEGSPALQREEGESNQNEEPGWRRSGTAFLLSFCYGNLPHITFCMAVDAHTAEDGRFGYGLLLRLKAGRNQRQEACDRECRHGADTDSDTSPQ